MQGVVKETASFIHNDDDVLVFVMLDYFGGHEGLFMLEVVHGLIVVDEHHIFAGSDDDPGVFLEKVYDLGVIGQHKQLAYLTLDWQVRLLANDIVIDYLVFDLLLLVIGDENLSIDGVIFILE